MNFFGVVFTPRTVGLFPRFYKKKVKQEEFPGVPRMSLKSGVVLKWDGTPFSFLSRAYSKALCSSSSLFKPGCLFEQFSPFVHLRKKICLTTPGISPPLVITCSFPPFFSHFSPAFLSLGNTRSGSRERCRGALVEWGGSRTHSARGELRLLSLARAWIIDM